MPSYVSLKQSIEDSESNNQMKLQSVSELKTKMKNKITEEMWDQFQLFRV